MKLTEKGYQIVRTALASSIGGVRLYTKQGSIVVPLLCPVTFQDTQLIIVCSAQSKLMAKIIKQKPMIVTQQGQAICQLDTPITFQHSNGTVLLKLKVKVG